MHWRHKQMLERFAGRKDGEINYASMPGIGEECFRSAIANGWVEPVSLISRKWWQASYRLTDKGRRALAARRPTQTDEVTE